MATPSITSLSVASGPASGGDLVVLRGPGLSARVAVTFDPSAVSPDEIRAKIEALGYTVAG